MTREAIIHRIVWCASGLSRERLLELAEVASDLAELEGVREPSPTPREAVDVVREMTGGTK